MTEWIDIYEHNSVAESTPVSPGIGNEIMLIPLRMNANMWFRRLVIWAESVGGAGQFQCALYRTQSQPLLSKDQMVTTPLTFDLAYVATIGGAIDAPNNTPTLFGMEAGRDILIESQKGVYFIAIMYTPTVRFIPIIPNGGIAGVTFAMVASEPFTAVGAWPPTTRIMRNAGGVPSARVPPYIALLSARGVYFYTGAQPVIG